MTGVQTCALPIYVASILTGATKTQRPPDTLKSKPPFAIAGNQDALQLSGITPVKSKPPFAMPGNQDALQLSGINPVFAVGMQEGVGENDPRAFHMLQDHSSPTPTTTV